MMYDQYPIYDVPQNNIVQRFFAQRWSAILLEIVMTVVITVAARAAFDFFDPLDGARATSADAAQAAVDANEFRALETAAPLAFIIERGKAYLADRRFAAALAMFDWAVALSPEDADAYAWRGYAKMQAGDYLEAQADNRRLLELNPRSFDAHNALCWAYGETRDFDPAIAHCQEGLRQAGNRANYAIALENWCWLQVEMGEIAAAAKTCRFALEYAPEYVGVQALAHYNMGRVALAQGRTGEALPHFQAALRLGSSYAKMYLEIGEIYATLGYRSLAQASYERYRQLADGVEQAQG